MQNGKKTNKENCKHTRHEELREGQGGYDPNCTTWICLDCGHTWSYEIEIEPRDPFENL